MKIFIRTAFIFFSAILFSTESNADQSLSLPNGGHCWVNDAGVAYGCDGGGQSDNGAGAAAIQEAKVSQAKAKELDKCLRKADWPGQPSRSECQSMYGAQ